MSQQQIDAQTRQRVLAMELSPAQNGLNAVLFLSFGIALAKGVTLKVDNGQVGQPYSFRTGLPADSVVPLALNGAFIAILQRGTTLKIKAVADGGAEMSFSVSLRGFAAANARIAALTH